MAEKWFRRELLLFWVIYWVIILYRKPIPGLQMWRQGTETTNILSDLVWEEDLTLHKIYNAGNILHKSGKAIFLESFLGNYVHDIWNLSIFWESSKKWVSSDESKITNLKPDGIEEMSFCVKKWASAASIIVLHEHKCWRGKKIQKTGRVSCIIITLTMPKKHKASADKPFLTHVLPPKQKTLTLRGNQFFWLLWFEDNLYYTVDNSVVSHTLMALRSQKY